MSHIPRVSEEDSTRLVMLATLLRRREERVGHAFGSLDCHGVEDSIVEVFREVRDNVGLDVCLNNSFGRTNNVSVWTLRT